MNYIPGNKKQNELNKVALENREIIEDLVHIC